MKALITLAAVLSAVFAAAPAALADTFITDTLSGNGHPQQTQDYRFVTDTLGGSGGPRLALNPTAPDIRQTDPRAAGPIPSYPFITDTLAPGGGPPLPAAPSSPGFNWADAGIGAAAAASAVFVLLGGTLLAARRRGTLAV